MRIAVGLLMLGLLANGTARHLPSFQSDLRLWETAVAASPLLPRPALNLATAYRKAGRNREAVIWLVRAGELADRSARADEIRAGVTAQLLFLSAFGDDVCGRPAVQPYC